MLTESNHIELYRPFGACVVGDSPFRRVAPYAMLCRPFGAYIDK